MASMPKPLWPNFFIAGAPRAGTTSLYQYLKLVPGIYLSPVKEPRFFRTNKRRSEEQYLALFRGAKKNEAIGEASVSYLRDSGTPTRIKDIVGEARIIIIVRDPVEAVHSHFFEFVRREASDLTFEQAAAMEEHSDAFYCEHVRRYFDVFGTDRVKVIVFEEFVQNTRQTVGEVMAFLEVEGAPPEFEARAYNSYTAPRAPRAGGILSSNRYRRLWRAVAPASLRQKVSRRQVLYRPAEKPPMAEATRRFLQDKFRGDIECLEKLLGRTLPWYHRKIPGD